MVKDVFKDKKNIIIIVLAIVVIALVVTLVIFNSNSKKVSKSDAVKKHVKNVEVASKDEAVDSDEESDVISDNYFDTNSQVESAGQAESTDEVVTYINNIVDEADNALDSNDVVYESKFKNTFVTLTDFIFYDGTIKGRTFSELREEQKQKVIALWEKLDQKIEAKYPNYKETIKEKSSKTYSNIKEKATALKETISAKISASVSEDVKEQASIDTENLKEITSAYKEKAKEGYSKAKSKISEWYSNYKSEP